MAWDLCEEKLQEGMESCPSVLILKHLKKRRVEHLPIWNKQIKFSKTRYFCSLWHCAKKFLDGVSIVYIRFCWLVRPFFYWSKVFFCYSLLFFGVLAHFVVYFGAPLFIYTLLIIFLFTYKKNQNSLLEKYTMQELWTCQHFKNYKLLAT